MIAGAVAAVVAVVAVVFVALPEPAPQAPPAPPPPPTEPVTPQAPTTPASSSLQELIPTQVGSFTLVQIQPIPQAVSAGALEAYDAVYQGANGSSIGAPPAVTLKVPTPLAPSLSVTVTVTV